VSLRDLGLRAAVVSEAEVGDALVLRYLTPLAASRGIGAQLEQSVLAWLEAGMMVEAAARALVVHPNTLRYRLKRFEELTATDLRDARQVVEVWWALERATGTPRRHRHLDRLTARRALLRGAASEERALQVGRHRGFATGRAEPGPGSVCDASRPAVAR
jgi:hypothetical protein